MTPICSRRDSWEGAAGLCGLVGLLHCQRSEKMRRNAEPKITAWNAATEYSQRESTQPDAIRKQTVEVWRIWLRLPKNFPRIRAGTHSSIQVLQVTPATAPRQLETRNQPTIQRLARAGLSRGIHGRMKPRATQLSIWSVAAETVSVFGGFHRMRNGETKSCRKFPTNGSDPRTPIEVDGSG
jgi:hypothetical protein